MLGVKQAALEKKFEKAEGLCKEALVYAARTGHLHHAALFNERFAAYYLEVHGNLDDYKYHMIEAIRY